PRRGRSVLQPVHEEDVVETLARALDGRAAWEGWYEVVGLDVWSLAELEALGRRAGRVAGDDGEWEPDLEILAAQRLAEPGPWVSHFGIAPRSIQSLVEERT